MLKRSAGMAFSRTPVPSAWLSARLLLAGLFLAGIVLSAAPVRADDMTRVSVGLGGARSTTVLGYEYGDGTSAVELALAVTAVRGGWVYGGSVGGSAGLFRQNDVFFMGHFGRRLAEAPIELALEGGAHRISDIGSEFLTRTEVPSVLLPAVGARLDLGNRVIGLVAVARYDVVRRNVEGVVEEEVWGSGPTERGFTAGGTYVGLMLRLGHAR